MVRVKWCANVSKKECDFVSRTSIHLAVFMWWLGGSCFVLRELGKHTSPLMRLLEITRITQIMVHNVRNM